MWVKTQKEVYIDIDNFCLVFVKDDLKSHQIVTRLKNGEILVLGAYIKKYRAVDMMGVLKRAIENNYTKTIVM